MKHIQSQTKKGFLETILSHPFAFVFITHSIIEVVQYIRTGKLDPFVNVSMQVMQKDKDEPEENND